MGRTGQAPGVREREGRPSRDSVRTSWCQVPDPPVPRSTRGAAEGSLSRLFRRHHVGGEPAGELLLRKGPSSESPHQGRGLALGPPGILVPGLMPAGGVKRRAGAVPVVTLARGTRGRDRGSRPRGGCAKGFACHSVGLALPRGSGAADLPRGPACVPSRVPSADSKVSSPKALPFATRRPRVDKQGSRLVAPPFPGRGK